MKRFELDASFLEGRSARSVLGSPYFRRGPLQVAPRQNVVDEPPQVQAVANPVTGSREADLSMSNDVRLMRLRFFRDLPEERRRRILVELEAIPADLTDRLDHTTEQRFFAKLVAQGRLDKLSAAIDSAAAYQKQGDIE